MDPDDHKPNIHKIATAGGGTVSGFVALAAGFLGGYSGWPWWSMFSIAAMLFVSECLRFRKMAAAVGKPFEMPWPLIFSCTLFAYGMWGLGKIAGWMFA